MEDLVTITQEQKQVSLLSLPRSDTSPDSNEGKNELLMMQLPKGVKVSDLISDCSFVSSRKAGAKGQVSLVMESKKQSFTVSRLDTSNVLVMVPPVSTAAIKPISVAPREQKQQPVAKKPKLSLAEPTELLPIKARLLKPGGSGASFLELKAKDVPLPELTKLLTKHVYHPFVHQNNHYRRKVVGLSIPTLASQLQTSQGQVEAALQKIRAFPIPKDDNTTTTNNFGLLSEEALLEAQTAIVSTLAEVDECADYANKGVMVESLVTQAMERLPLDKNFSNAEHVLRYAMTSFLANDDGPLPFLVQASTTEPICLDVSKVCQQRKLSPVVTQELELVSQSAYFSTVLLMLDLDCHLVGSSPLPITDTTLGRTPLLPSMAKRTSRGRNCLSNQFGNASRRCHLHRRIQRQRRGGRRDGATTSLGLFSGRKIAHQSERTI